MKPKIDFELNEYMTPLTKEEKSYILPNLIKLLKNSSMPMTSGEICKKIDDLRHENGMLWKSKMNPARVRKLVNHIRTNELLGIVGDVNGYLATDDETLLREQILRQEQRINAELAQLNGTKNYLNKLLSDDSIDELGFKWEDVETISLKVVETSPEQIKMVNDMDFWELAGIKN